jgi:hypothetical protein
MIISPHSVSYGRRQVTTHVFNTHVLVGDGAETDIAWHRPGDHSIAFPWDMTTMRAWPQTVMTVSYGVTREYEGSADFQVGPFSYSVELWTVDSAGSELDKLATFGNDFAGVNMPPSFGGSTSKRANGIKFKLNVTSPEDGEQTVSVDVGDPCLIVWDFDWPYPFDLAPVVPSFD